MKTQIKIIWRIHMEEQKEKEKKKGRVQLGPRIIIRL